MGSLIKHECYLKWPLPSVISDMDFEGLIAAKCHRTLVTNERLLFWIVFPFKMVFKMPKTGEGFFAQFAHKGYVIFTLDFFIKHVQIIGKLLRSRLFLVL